MTTTRLAIPATTDAYQLAEGPVWDAARRRLLWVDILGGAVLEGRLTTDGIEVVRRLEFDSMVGAVTVAASGSLLVAAQEDLVLVRSDGGRVVGPRLVPAGSGRRLNDGGTDPAGRFLVGTLLLAGESETEVLVRLEADGRLTEIDSDLSLSNGLAWSSDGRRMFSVDTYRQIVWVREYDVDTGAVGQREPYLRMKSGLPDGIAMDVADHLWVAAFGEGEVRRYAPDGGLVDRITVPAPHTTSVAFAGDDLRQLVVTTGSGELTEAEQRQWPESGRLFTVRVDVPGVPIAPWREETPLPANQQTFAPATETGD